MREHTVKFTKLSKFSPFMVLGSTVRMSNFVMGVSGLVPQKCKKAMLLNEMDNSRLMNYVEKIEDERIS